MTLAFTASAGGAAAARAAGASAGTRTSRLPGLHADAAGTAPGHRHADQRPRRCATRSKTCGPTPPSTAAGSALHCSSTKPLRAPVRMRRERGLGGKAGSGCRERPPPRAGRWPADGYAGPRPGWARPSHRSSASPWPRLTSRHGQRRTSTSRRRRRHRRCLGSVLPGAACPRGVLEREASRAITPPGARRRCSWRATARRRCAR